MSEVGGGTPGSPIEGWRADPFGRHEARFHDGSRWTPHVKDGDTHALDDPVEGIVRDTPGPEILTAGLLVVEQHTDAQPGTEPLRVFGSDGGDLGTVRQSSDEPDRIEVVGGDGLVALTLTRASSPRKTVATVRDANGAEMGRLLQQHLPGMTTYALGSAAGGNVGFVRARTWTGWDIRIEDERNWAVARISKQWHGLDRAAFPAAEAYVARIDRDMRDPQRALVYAAVLTVDILLRKDTRKR